MILYREISWWYWAVTSVLLIAGVARRFRGFLSGHRAERHPGGSFPDEPRQLHRLSGAVTRGLHGDAASGAVGTDELAVLGTRHWHAGAGSVRLLLLGAHPVAYAMEPARTPLGRFVAENFSLSAG